MSYRNRTISLYLFVLLTVVPLVVSRASAGSGAVIEAKRTMIVFGARHCASCRLMTPVMNELKKKHQDRVTIVYLDADENQEEARRHKIQVLPTQIFLDPKGREVSRHLGFWDTESIEAQFGVLGVSGTEQAAGKLQ